MSKRRTAIIIGGGPAGLTAALELLERTDIKPIVYEGSDNVGGIARTFMHAGNRIDIGGHRFFSKSDRVMDWWSRILPLQGRDDGRDGPVSLGYQNKSRWLDMPADGPNPDLVDDVMLLRARKSRILWNGKLFDYPLSLNLKTLRKLGLGATILIGFSFLRSRLAPIRPERSLRDFFINRFGRRLYNTFFRDYTEKVWGVPCELISAEWGAQRVKGLSLLGVVKHAFGALFRRRGNIAQKDVETSLIEQFLYPKYGPGQMWERVADLVRQGGRRSSHQLPDYRLAAYERPDRRCHNVERRGCPAGGSRGLLLFHHRCTPVDECHGTGPASRRQRSLERPDLSRLHHSRPIIAASEAGRRRNG